MPNISPPIQVTANIQNILEDYLNTEQPRLKDLSFTYERFPLVSVIIPSYNHARYLPLRIESILNQTFPFLEVIILDDCSTDDSHIILEQYRNHPKVKKIIFNETNSGSPFKQWNRGIKEASGTLIWIAETDDYADENFLYTLIRYAADHPEAGIVYCQSWNVDEQGNVLGTHLKHTKSVDAELWKENFLLSGDEMIPKYMLSRNVIPNASAVIFRKDLYMAIGGADENYRLSGDWLVWLRMLSITSVAFWKEPLNYFRTHRQSVRIMTARSRETTEYFRLFSHFYSFISHKPWRDVVLNHVVKLFITACIDGKAGIRKTTMLYHELKAVDTRAARWLIKKLKNTNTALRLTGSVLYHTLFGKSSS